MSTRHYLFKSLADGTSRVAVNATSGLINRTRNGMSFKKSLASKLKSQSKGSENWNKAKVHEKG